MSSAINIYKLNVTYNEFMLLDIMQKELHLTSHDGLEICYENTIKLYSYELTEMFSYFTEGFSWDGTKDANILLSRETSYIMNKSQILSLIEWFISLSYIYGTSTHNPNNIKYLEQSKFIKNSYKAPYEYFKFSFLIFTNLKNDIVDSSIDMYLWEFNF